MFKIQISNPEILYIIDDNDTNIEEAIQTIFPLETEYAFMIWNNIFIPLSYKYDISLMVKDFILIIKFLKEEEEQMFQFHWTSNTFASLWGLTKKGDFIEIKTAWSTVIGGVESLLNSNAEMTINSVVLIQEIQSILVFIKESLTKVGYNSENLEDFSQLEELVN